MGSVSRPALASPLGKLEPFRRSNLWEDGLLKGWDQAVSVLSLYPLGLSSQKPTLI
jgi:hypothetical protein